MDKQLYKQAAQKLKKKHLETSKHVSQSS